MIKILYVIYLILNCGDIIYWSENSKLQYSDFQQEAPINPQYNGMSSTSFQYYYWFNQDSLFIESKSFFLKKESWLFQKDSATLKHEQGHFDISEIYCRKFRYELSALLSEGIDTSQLKTQLDSLIKINYHQCLSIHDKYDAEVKSVYGNEQHSWNNRIFNKLEESSNFKSEIIKFSIQN